MNHTVCAIYDGTEEEEGESVYHDNEAEYRHYYSNDDRTTTCVHIGAIFFIFVRLVIRVRVALLLLRHLRAKLTCQCANVCVCVCVCVCMYVCMQLAAVVSAAQRVFGLCGHERATNPLGDANIQLGLLMAQHEHETTLNNAVSEDAVDKPIASS
eukprot:COSAG05_NODE_2064_length_3620_cov_1.541323_3_plen_155_part_00